MLPEPLVQEVYVFPRAGYSRISLSLHFEQLWFSVILSVYWENESTLMKDESYTYQCVSIRLQLGIVLV